MKARLLVGVVLVLILVVVLREGVSAQSQGWWTLSGSNLYPNSTAYNVGIGTTSPASKFHMVRTNSGAQSGQRFGDAAIFENGGNVFLQLHGSNSGEKSINFAKPTNGADGAIKYNFQGVPGGVPDGFGFWVSGNQFAMAIAGDGKVGVNTFSPTHTMDVEGGLFSARPVQIGGEATRPPAALIDAENGPITWEAILDLRTGPAATHSALIVDAAGDVGIGTAGFPTNILTIQQNSNTDPIADAWTVYSSRRWKTNVKTIEGALEKVQRLRGVRFEWRANGKYDIGLIAEEVGEVIPEVVTYEENGVDAKSVDYGRLVPVLIQAIKEQQMQITTLEHQIVTLERRVAALKAEKATTR